MTIGSIQPTSNKYFQKVRHASSLNSENKNIESAEVVDIILNDKHPKYKSPKDIGSIFFRRLKSDFNIHSSNAIQAFPIDPYSLKYPTVFEQVLVIPGPSHVSGILNLDSWYYISIFNVWNFVNVNPLPFSSADYEKESKTEDTSTTERVSENSIILGEYFTESPGVPNLQPFEGDIIHLGRWGNSIRLGSTTQMDKKSNWSKTGKDGDPIIIISNTSPKNTKQQQIKVEDINKDDSSIYLCSNQKIDLSVASTNYSAYTNSPILPKNYLGNQIIFNSDRIVLNAKTDDILFNSKNSIGLSTNGTINLSSNSDCILNGSRHLLGVNANEPVLLGRKTIQIISEILDAISVMIVQTPSGPSSPPSNATQFQAIKGKLTTLLSQKSFSE